MLNSAVTRGVTDLNVAPRILLVDDLPDNLRLLGQLFENDQLEISFAKNGIRAVKLAELSKFAIAVLDINLPDLDGYEVARRIKAVQPDCELIFCSAHNDRENRDKAFMLGAIDFIEKPYDLNLTRTRMRLHVERVLLRHSILVERDRMDGVLDGLHDAVVSVDQHDRIIYWNHGAERVFGVQKGHILGKPIGLFLPEHSEHRSLKTIASKTGEAAEDALINSIKMVNWNGTPFTAELSVSESGNGNNYIQTAVIRDISVYSQVNARNHLFERAMEHCNAAYALIDENNQIVESNSEFRKFFTRTAEHSTRRTLPLAETLLAPIIDRFTEEMDEISLSDVLLDDGHTADNLRLVLIKSEELNTRLLLIESLSQG